MTPEARVKEAIKRELKRVDAYWHMPVMNGMGAPTLDFVCCLRGRYFVIEAKAPDAVPTPRQRITMQQIIDHGGAAFFIDGSELSFATFRFWAASVP